MSVFEDIYARHYDSMYATKDYDAEVAFVARALQEGQISSRAILSLGAGTLNYELLLAQQGYPIVGIDISPAMVSLGKEKLAQKSTGAITLSVADMLQLPDFPEKFGAAVALFNVISYCRTTAELGDAFAGVARNLVDDGLFILDCWNAEAVRKSPPENRWKKFTIGTGELYRLTEVISVADAAVQLSIELLEIQDNKVSARGTEAHHVRGWDREELRAVAASAGFDLLHESVFPDWDAAPSETQWALGVVFKKVR